MKETISVLYVEIPSELKAWLAQQAREEQRKIAVLVRRILQEERERCATSSIHEAHQCGA